MMNDIELLKRIYADAVASAMKEEMPNLLFMYRENQKYDGDTEPPYISRHIDLCNDINNVAFEIAEQSVVDFYDQVERSEHFSVSSKNDTISFLCEHYLESAANGDVPHNKRMESEVVMLSHSVRNK